jgi:hypothetical protein
MDAGAADAPPIPSSILDAVTSVTRVAVNLNLDTAMGYNYVYYMDNDRGIPVF